MYYLKLFLPAGLPLQGSIPLASTGLARHGNVTEHEPLLKTIRWVWVEWFACACLILSLHDHFFPLTEAVMKLQFEPSGNCDHLCTVLTPRRGVTACPPWTPSEWPHGEEEEVGIHSHMVSPSGRLLSAPGADTVPSCTRYKGSVWYTPPTVTHAENMEMATGMRCDGHTPVHGADTAAGAAWYRREPRKNTVFPSGPKINLKRSTRRCLLWSFDGCSMNP